MAKFSVILDACVLYPAPIRDLMMRLSLTDLFNARWTDQIHEEWISALVKKGYDRDYLEKTRRLMDRHVRDGKVDEYEDLIDSITLPDQDDRHVVAAAIKSNSDAIVTFNLKDFPETVLEKYAIEVIHPDDFILYQVELSVAKVCQALKDQRQALKNPPKTVNEFLAILQKQQLPKTALALKELSQLL